MGNVRHAGPMTASCDHLETGILKTGMDYTACGARAPSAVQRPGGWNVCASVPAIWTALGPSSW